MERADGLAAELLRTSKKYGMLERGDKVLAALSGGADSTALTVLLCGLSEELGIEVCAAHLNHCLRGEEADRDERFARTLCETLGIPVETARLDIAEIAKNTGFGIEETARKERYAFLRKAAFKFGCTKIATAHNADDNAETMLLNLVRGAGLRGLCGIPPVRGNIIRPLLCSTRESIEKYLSEKGIGFVTDKTNSDISYTRNKIRHQVIPLLKGINPSLIGGVGDTSELLRADADFLDGLASSYAASGGAASKDGEKIQIEADLLHSIPYAMSGRIIRNMYMAARASGEDSTETGGTEKNETDPAAEGLSKRHADSVLRLAGSPDPSGEISLPHGIKAKRIYNILVFSPARRVGMPADVQEGALLDIGEVHFGDWLIKTETSGSCISENGGDTVFLKPELLCGGLIVRGIRTGDAISPAGRGWTKTLKKLYIDAKIPRGERAGRPVVACSGGVCAVPGFRADRKFAADVPPALKITFLRDKNAADGK